MKQETAAALRRRKQYAGFRLNTVLMIALTFVNMVIVAINLDFYFPFSATFPMVMLDINGVKDGDPVSIVLLVACILVMAAFVCAWCFSKTHYACAIVLLTLFSLDCGFLIYVIVLLVGLDAFSASIVIDVLFHAWVMYYLIVGVISGAKLKKCTQQGLTATEKDILLAFEGEEYFAQQNPAAVGENGISAGNETAAAEASAGNGLPDSPVLRDFDGKGMMTYLSVCYRNVNVIVNRKGSKTELVVDGKVYAEKKGLVFKSYELTCNYRGVAYKFTHKVGMVATLSLYADDELIGENRM